MSHDLTFPTGRLAAAIAVSALLVACADSPRVADAVATAPVAKVWPELGGIRGWHRERETDSRYVTLVLHVPDGKNQDDTPAWIWARRVSRGLFAETLDGLVEHEKRWNRHGSADQVLEEGAPIEVAPGLALRTLVISSRAEGFWKRIAFGEDGSQQFVFTLFTTSPEALADAMEQYEGFVRRAASRFRR